MRIGIIVKKTIYFRKREFYKRVVKKTVSFTVLALTFAAAGLTRPAPAEPSQGRKAARVGGCSGAM